MSVQPPRNPPKPFWASKTFWGSVGMILGANLPIILPRLGVTDPKDIVDLMQIVCGPSGVVALVGRFTAKRGLR